MKPVNGSMMSTATIANIVCVFAICLPMSSGESDCMKSSICGRTVISARSRTALKMLNIRLSTAVLLPFLFVVSEARRFGVTEPIAAPITRYTAALYEISPWIANVWKITVDDEELCSRAVKAMPKSIITIGFSMVWSRFVNSGLFESGAIASFI